MKLLPQTRRGTWLLAASAWLGSCVLIWFVMPVGRRATMPMPTERSVLIGFGPNADTAVINLYQPGDDAKSSHSSYSVIEVPAGRILNTFVDSNEYALIGFSSDGRVWLFHRRRRDNAKPRFLIANLLTRSIAPMNELPSEVEGTNYLGLPLDGDTRMDRSQREMLSADGRICVLHPAAHSESIVLWDLVANRTLDIAKKLHSPVVIAGNGKTLAAADAEKTNIVRVVDLATGETQSRLEFPSLATIQGLYISHDGRVVSARTSHFQLWTWNVGTGLPPVADPQSRRIVPTMGVSVLVAPDYSTEQNSERFSVSSTPLEPMPIEPSLHDFARSPNGAIVLEAVEVSATTPIRRLVENIGLTWPFKSARSRIDARLHDAASGEPIGTIPVQPPAFLDNGAGAVDFRWLPNQRGLAVRNSGIDGNYWEIWDIPPRKQAKPFILWAGLLGAVLTSLAFWQMRRIIAPQRGKP
jgi:hypothetical protein